MPHLASMSILHTDWFLPYLFGCEVFNHIQPIAVTPAFHLERRPA
jgi:hypothetical protein